MLPVGFEIIENFITENEEDALITNIDNLDWSNSLTRRTQQYGYKYNFYGGTLPEETDQIPNFLGEFINRIESEQELNQVIINEYTPGQGIAPHIDSKVFGNTIYSISLGGLVVYELSYGEEKITCPIPRRSLVKMTGDVRYKWKHSIPHRKTDIIDGEKIKRTRRISVTFRALPNA